jgi:serine/threonine protein phosphatase PrpC
MATAVSIMAVTRKGSAHEICDDALGVNGCTVWSNGTAAFPPWGFAARELRMRAPVAAVVADGVSGTPGARDAALLTASQASLLHDHRSEAELRARVEAIHDDLVARRDTDGRPLDMGSTLAGVVVGESGELTIFHVGDSRVYYVNGSSFVHTDDDVKALPMSDRVMPFQWLGMPEIDRLDLHVDVLPSVPWRRVLICSDGLVARLGGNERADQTIEDVVLAVDPRTKATRHLPPAMADLFPDGEPSLDDDETAVLLDVFTTPECGSEPVPAVPGSGSRRAVERPRAVSPAPGSVTNERPAKSRWGIFGR